MYRNIIVAVDDSETSRCALTEAVNIARATNARLHIAHVADEVLLGMHHRAVSTTLDFDRHESTGRDDPASQGTTQVGMVMPASQCDSACSTVTFDGDMWGMRRYTRVGGAPGR